MNDKGLKNQLEGLFSDLEEPIGTEEGRPAFLEDAVEDITEHKRAEEALAEERNLLRTLIDNLPDLVYAKDTESRFLIGNTAIMRLMGATTPDELLGKTDFDFYPQELAAQYYADEQEIIRSGQPLVNREEPLMDQVTGKRGWLSTTKVPLRDSEGKIVGIVGIGRDITGRKRAEEALRESEEKYRTILENIEHGYYEVDIAGKFTFFNDSLCRIFGYSEDELMGMNFQQLMDDETAKAVYQTFNAVYRTGKPVKALEHELIRKDGTRTFVEVSASLMRGPTGEPVGFQGIIRDITERKRTEEALRISEERFALAVQGANDGIWDWDIKNNTLYWSPRLKELLGYTDNELDIDFDTFDSLLHPEDRERTAAAIETYFEERGPYYDVEQRMRTKSGEYRWFRARGQALWDEAGNPVRMVGSTSDITERKQAEEALRDEKALMDALMDNIPDSIYFKDRQCRLVRINRKMMRDLNLDEMSQAIGKTDVDLFGEEFGRKTLADDQRVMTTGEPIIDSIESRQLEDGQINWTLTAKVPLRDASGQIMGLVGITHEINELMRAQEERERLLVALEHRSIQLQTAAEVSRATSSILAPDELIQQVVDLVCERFDLYYAGLFLVDQTGEWTSEPGKWAVLRAGSGEAGRKMLEAGHKLEIGGTSMIGWCVANKQARIALDVGEEAVRFDNPLLPETRSEMALPLISRGQVIGAMTIQSAQAAAFSEEDITVLQTMADQLANAIENARLFEDTKSQLARLTALRETTEAVASTLELDKLLNLITQQATNFLQGDGGIINLVDWEKKEDEVVAASGSAASALGYRSPLEGSLSGWVALHNQPVLSNRLQDDSRADWGPRSWLTERRKGQAQSAAIAPLTIKDQVIGTLVVMDKQGGKGEFDQADLDLLIAFANQAATGIENARLFEQTQHTSFLMGLRVKELACLSDIGRKMEETPPVPEFLQWAAGRIPSAMCYSDVCLAAIQFEGQVYGAAEAMSLPCQVVQALRIGGEVVGRIYIAYIEDHDFLDEESALMGDIGRRVSGYIENRRLFEQTQETLKEIEAAHRLYVREQWAEYVPAQATPSYERTRPGVTPLGDAPLPEVEQAVARQEIVVQSGTGDGGEQTALVAPINLRGEVIGALGLHDTETKRQWTDQEIALVEAVADQMALAIENARAYAELQRTAEQLKEMDRIKTQFLANMSHELRTPLNSIIGFSRVILKGIDGPLTEKQKTDLTSIHNNGQHLLGLINDVLDISRIEAGKMELIFEPVDLRHIIRGVMSTAIALVKDKPIELKEEMDPDLPTIRGDGTRVRQVVLNLLANAAKFTEEGQITLRAHADEEYVTISVSDTGMGISAEDQATLFEEFRQVDASPTRRAGGAGLGLSISRHLVEMHGGRIWVESEPGVGSTFSFTLPVTGPEAERAEELETLTGLIIHPDRKLILAVEDDEGAITLYKRYLEKHGYQVVGLGEGEQAVRWARELSPYAIILDVLLPDKDGWAVLEELKSSRETRQIPLIICTILSDGEARGLSMGAADYLVKPILEEDLLQSLERLEERQQV